MRGARSAVALLLLLPAGATPHAAPAPAAGTGVAEEMILFQDLPSVFGASKYEQRQEEAPASVTVITAEEIETYGHRTLGDVLRSVRGFFLTYDRNYSYLGARGFGRTGDYNTRVLLLVDGHRTNDSIYDSTYFGTESIVDVEIIDRVEIIRGPSSSLYGTNAVLGVINVITKNGRDVKGAEYAAEGGSFSTYEGRATYGNRLDNGLDLFLTGAYYDSGGPSLYFPEFDDPLTDFGRTGHIDDDAYRSFFGRAEHGNLRVEAGYKFRRKTIPTAPYGTDFNDGRTQTTDERGFVNFRHERALANKGRLLTTLAYDYYYYDGDYIYGGGASSDYGHGRWWTASAQYVVEAGRRHKAIAGGEFRYNAQVDQGVYGAFEDERSTDLWALFVQDEMRLGRRAMLNVGLRHDRYDTFGGTTNPRAALIVGLGDAVALKVLYGRAFRAPNAYELFYDDGGLSQKGNADLKPEVIQTYEVAVEGSLPGGLRLTGSLYRYAIRDLIVFQNDPMDMLNYFDNVERVEVDGAEIEVEGRLGGPLEGRLSLALQDGENATTGEELVNSPRFLAKLNLTAPVFKKRFSAGLETQYTGGRRTLAGGEAGGHAVTNLVLFSRAWLPRTALSFGVYNLFDREFGDPAGEEHTQDVIPQDGRTYRVQVRYRF
jgi:iron complex outermembrane receptor protein